MGAKKKKITGLLISALLILALGAWASVAQAFTPSNHVSFTLEGCRNDGTITLPDGNGDFICPDAASRPRPDTGYCNQYHT